ncbi:hypothetical protein ON010_g6222 [Phytophthora cinnamomi]|nr:hypothetical protein ON010_g6222 [Phytophthora cinnamomi]
MQDHGHGWQPVAYARKVTSTTEANYGITELECLAVVWSIKMFRPYLYGRHFTILTDHSALKWLMTSPKLTGKLHRWALTSQAFDFDVQYRPGSTNVVADALSRAPATATVMAAVGRRRRSRRRAAARVTNATANGTAAVTTTGSGRDTELQDGGGSNGELSAAGPGGIQPAEQQAVTDDEAQPAQDLMRTTAGAAAQQPLAAASLSTGDDEQMTTKNGTDDDVEYDMSERDMRAVHEDRVDGRNERLMVDGDGARHEQEAEVPTSVVGTEAMTAALQTRTRKQRARRSGRSVSTTRALTRAAKKRPEAEQQRVLEMTVTRETTSESATDKHQQQRGRRVDGGEAANDQRRRGGCVRPPVAMASGEPSTDHGERVAVMDWETASTDATAQATGARTKTTPQHGADGQRRERFDDGERRAPNKQSGPEHNDDEQLEQRSERVQRRAVEPTLQLTDGEIIDAQTKSRLVRRMIEAGEYHGQKVTKSFILVVIETQNGQRVILPPVLWATVMKECHDSVWARHLRAPHTYARIAQTYWWSGLRNEVKRWVLGCQECGSRKARPREVIPPLRSIRGGDVGDRWALDVAGPLPTTNGGERYVIAAVEYVTRYANVVLKFGDFREILTDGAPELTGKVIEQLVIMLQAQQVNPVPYRSQMIGLVERFHRTWKNCIATYMNDEKQRDWDVWVGFAVYAYNSGRHFTVMLSPNELMMGRRLRNPNDLLRATSVTEAGPLTDYHRRLLAAMASSHECAEVARRREQERQARYYDRKVRKKRVFAPGDRLWLYKPPRGPKASKLVHQWLGPVRVVEPAGYDNYLVEREDVENDPEQFIAHSSFLVSYHYPTTLLTTAAADIEPQLEHENALELEHDEPEDGTAVAATTARVQAATAARTTK